MKTKRVNKLEKRIKPKTVQEDILDGLDAFDDIISQVNIIRVHPRKLYQMIRAAQEIRIDSLDTKESYVCRYSDDKITLTISEKNFVHVHEQDIKGGILRKTAFETNERILELLREQENA